MLRNIVGILILLPTAHSDRLSSSEPHVSSPCGHTFCAECVVEWMKKNISNAPKCPLCRTALTQGSLVAPNFALKATIDKYVAALAESGLVDWQSQGKRYMEWVGRNA
ncbi:hypothetical protein K466DRAFT_544693 [Polyporus arcularius HHB13444]|uniref:RING-type domain-containing protein n=2 Tax=Polyporaceae TaxID=5317 RepID=A0A5C3PJP6_9APHY|nr:hypothetical protein K466DRAFT_544693 [Polyporus arcularius HHB13444]